VLRQGEDRYGYATVGLCFYGEQATRTVHALVAEAFFGARPAYREVAHNNGDRRDNRLENLRYATCRENCADRKQHGNQRQGSQVRGAKLTEAQIPEIRALRFRVPATKVAKAFGVSDTLIHLVWRRKAWAHV
jgi:hypothetical protein